MTAEYSSVYINSFLLCFAYLAVLVMSASVFLCGLFDITRGEEEVLPDGSIKRQGKIFRSWYFFWFKKYKEPLTIWYKGAELERMSRNLHKELVFNGLNVELTGVLFYNDHLYVNKMVQPGLLSGFARINNARVIIDGQEDRDVDKDFQQYMKVRFYQEYPDYVFPEWVREVMAGCITCSASVYGNIFFWVVYLIANNSRLHENLFLWADNYVPALVGVWLLYWVSVSFCATFLYKRFNK